MIYLVIKIWGCQNKSLSSLLSPLSFFLSSIPNSKPFPLFLFLFLFLCSLYPFLLYRLTAKTSQKFKTRSNLKVLQLTVFSRSPELFSMSESEKIKPKVVNDSFCTRGSAKQAYEAWTALPKGPRDLVIATGLNVFFDGLEGQESIPKIGKLIQAVVEHWWDTTHTFHFNWGEATVTPTDFMALTGLSFEGVPLYLDNTLIDDDVRLQALLGFSLNGICRGYEVKLKHLRSRYNTLLAAYASDPDLDEQVARTFLWYGLSQTIFADNGATAKIPLLGALEDLTAVGGIAWGAAGLAEMYWALDHCCRCVADSFDCFQFAFEAWAYEILGLNRFTTVGDRGTYPAMLRWVPAQRRQIGRNRMSYEYAELKTILRGRYHGDRYNMFPWVQIQGHLAGAKVATAQRRLLVGLNADSVYLGERVFGQHSEVSVPCVPHDPPLHMMDPDSLENRDALLAGVAAQELIVIGADYGTFAAERLGGPRGPDGVGIYCPVNDPHTYQHIDDYLDIRESEFEVPGVLLDRYRPSQTTISMMKSYIWLQTTDGAIFQVEQEVAVFCPFLCHEIHKGMGSSKNYPICLPPRVNAVALCLIFDYCRFHQVVGRSNKERKSFDEKFIKMDTKKLCELTSAADCLQLKPLVDLTSRALARMIEGKSPEEIRETFNLPDDLTEEEKLEPLKNITDDPRIRLLNRLYARKRRELKEKEKLKDVEVEVEHVDDRSVDDLLSFINGGDGDSKRGRTSKSKKKNRKRKDQQKNTHPASSDNDNGIQKKESNGSASACHDSEGNGHRFALEDEFDDDDLDDEIDPAIKEQIDREVEDFARRLNSDWPERLQELLSSGQ